MKLFWVLHSLLLDESDCWRARMACKRDNIIIFQNIECFSELFFGDGLILVDTIKIASSCLCCDKIIEVAVL